MRSVNLTPPMPGLKPVVFEKVKLREHPIPSQSIATIAPQPFSSEDSARSFQKVPSNPNLNDSLPPPPPASIFENDMEQDFDSFSLNRNKNSPPLPPPVNSSNNNSMIRSGGSQAFDFGDSWQIPPAQKVTPIFQAPLNIESPPQQQQQQRETTFPGPGAELPANEMNVENISVVPPPLVSTSVAPSSSSMPRKKYPENKFMMAPQKPPTSTPTSFMDLNVETIYPENRERLDDSVPAPVAPITTTTDRHNYLVTGQLSQELETLSLGSNSQAHQHNEFHPPPGFSRMVVGQTENNLEQPPPGLNRMVTGTEESNSDYNNLRQADGEVSQTPHHIPKTASNFIQSVHEVQDQLNHPIPISDRNSYLVPGESDINAQRGVIPGVESDSSLTNNIIQETPVQVEEERNVNVDGENVRDETIEGGNQQSSPLNLTKSQPVKSKVNYSTEESERNEESLVKTSRKPKHYDSNDSDSDRVDYHRGKRSSREKTNRDRDRKDDKEKDDDYYKYKRREKDRKYGRRRRDDYDSDGSKYDTERSVREKDRGHSRNSEDDDSRDRRDRYKKRDKYRGRDEKERDLDRSTRNREKEGGPRDKDSREKRDRERERYERDRKSKSWSIH